MELQYCFPKANHFHQLAIIHIANEDFLKDLTGNKICLRTLQCKNSKHYSSAWACRNFGATELKSNGKSVLPNSVDSGDKCSEAHHTPTRKRRRLALRRDLQIPALLVAASLGNRISLRLYLLNALSRDSSRGVSHPDLS